MDDTLDRGRHLRLDGANRLGILFEDGGNGVVRGVPIERPAPAQHFVDHGPEREHVAPRVGRLAADLLGRHVQPRPERRANLRQRWSTGGGNRRSRRHHDPVRFVDPGETEVEQLQPSGAGDQDIAGLHVAVRDAAAMRVAESVGEGPCMIDRFFHRQPAASQAGGQRLTLDELHHEVVGVAVLADVEELGDMRMVEGRNRLGFDAEAGAQVRAIAPAMRDDFDRDGAPEARVDGAVYLAHAAVADPGDDFMRSEPGSCREHHRGTSARVGGL